MRSGLLWLLIVGLMLIGCATEQDFSKPAFPWGGQDAAVPLPENPTTPVVDFDPRDLTGVWQGSGYDSLSEQPPPMTARGQALFDATVTGRTNRVRQAVPPAFGNDPIMRCDPYGFPRILVDDGRPNEMVHLPGRIVQFFERGGVWRDIWMDGRELPSDPDPRWMGYSVGRWEGDTLVVETIGLDDRSWIDQYGYRHSAAARVVERWRRVDGSTLEFGVTLYDAEIYTEPWVSDTKTFRLLPREGWPQGELREEFCVPSDEASFNQRVRDPAGGVIRH